LILAGQHALATRLAACLPFFYGWINLASICCAGFARQGPAVATLSIFVEPMTARSVRLLTWEIRLR
jgi:hypothetical protein